MPVLNGRFYMNPIFGAALERARKANGGREWSEESPESARQTAPAARTQHHLAHTAKASGAKHKGHTGDDYDPATTTQGIANQIYNETSGLRTTAHEGPGSDVDLQDARRAIGHVIHNRAAAKVIGGLASPELSSKEESAIKSLYMPAYDAYGESRSAAQVSSSRRDSTSGARFFYLDYGQSPPRWTQGKKLVGVFGPFENAAPPDGIPKDTSYRVRIYY